MFDIGFWEILIIGVVALLVVGPERLPALATFVGHWVGRIRRFANHMRSEIQQEFETEHLKSLLEEQNKELQSLKREVDDVRGDAEQVMHDSRSEVRSAARAVDEDPEFAPDALDNPDTEAASPTTGPGEGAPAEPAAQGGDAAKKKAAAKKTGTKKKSTAKKASAKKASTKKAAAKKTGAKKAGAKKAGAKKAGTRAAAAGGEAADGARADEEGEGTTGR